MPDNARHVVGALAGARYLLWLAAPRPDPGPPLRVLGSWRHRFHWPSSPLPVRNRRLSRYANTQKDALAGFPRRAPLRELGERANCPDRGADQRWISRSPGP